MDKNCGISDIEGYSVGDEQALIDGLLKGDSQCFELLVRNYGGKLLSTARRYLDSEADAQDVVQEAYIKVFQKIDSFRGASSLSTWLHRILVTTALMKIRSNKRRREGLIDDDSSGVADAFDDNGERLVLEEELALSVESIAQNQEVSAKVRAAIDSLAETPRALIMLRDIEGYNTGEVGELLGMSLSSVKTGLHRARKQLKLKLQA